MSFPSRRTRRANVPSRLSQTHLPPDTPSPEPSDDSSDEEGWIEYWFDAPLVAFLQIHYDIPIDEIDNLVPNVTELMEEV
jgi:hypothetical protein